MAESAVAARPVGAAGGTGVFTLPASTTLSPPVAADACEVVFADGGLEQTEGDGHCEILKRGDAGSVAVSGEPFCVPGVPETVAMV